MKMILFTLALIPGVTFAQTFEMDPVTGLIKESASSGYQPSYPIAVQPVLPVPRDRGPWGRGYSVVTETRERPDAWGRFLGDRDATTTTTTQRVVPNDALGQPIKGVELPW
jgi:hypothetical protein